MARAVALPPNPPPMTTTRAPPARADPGKPIADAAASRPRTWRRVQTEVMGDVLSVQARDGVSEMRRRLRRAAHHGSNPGP